MSLVLRRKDIAWQKHIAETCDLIDDYIFSVAESLRDDKHATSLLPLRDEMLAMFALYFRRQESLLLIQIGEHLRHVAANNRSAELSDDAALAAIAYALPNDVVLPLSTTANMTSEYARVMTATYTAGYQNLAAELAPSETVNPDAMANYLQANSLEKLTGELNGTTVSRLQTALATAYKSGATYEEMVQAIKAEFADMSTARAALIAQQELNTAYNAARLQLGRDMSFNEKSAAIESTNPCLACIANVMEGWIPMDQAFSSGDQNAPFHVGCQCSLDIRMNKETVQ